MSEVQARPSAPRGRGSARGGRGGYGSRGRGGRPAPTNGDMRDAAQTDSSEDQGEIGEMKKQYSSELLTLKELFPDWSDVDLVFALQENNGDLQTTIERISEGHVSQFSEIKTKTKDRSRSKPSERGAALVAAATERSTRGRSSVDTSRGGRGRPERGRGAYRGSRGGAQTATDGVRSAAAPTSVSTTESSAWDTSAPSADNNETAAWDAPATHAGTAMTAPAVASEIHKSSTVPESGIRKGGWAGLFATPKPAPAPPKPIAEAAPPLAEIGLPPPTTGAPAVEEEVPQESTQGDAIPIPPLADKVPTHAPEPAIEMRPRTPEDVRDEPALEITPSKDALTEDNVEHLPDTSNPPATDTAASTVADGRDIGVATPANEIPQPPIGRPPVGGFATSAYRAAGAAGRSASFQRRVLEQQEAVVMPGNHAVDRAAVQFGRMGLDGDADSLDVDDDREEAETRTQPPQHSPPAQPRASLPPAPRQSSIPDEAPVSETFPTPKQAPGLPPAPQQQQQLMQHQESPSASIPSQVMSQQGSQGGQSYSQFGRYGQPSMQPEQSAPAQKPYDPFGQQAPHSSQFEGYPSHAQAHNQQQQSSQSHLGGFSSAPTDYSSYYTSDQQRNPYQSYYGSAYGQQGSSAQQDAGASQQRSGSAFQGAPGESAFPSSQTQQAQSRYGEAQNSGHTTPNPVIGGQPAQSQQPQHMHHHQHHGQTQHGGGFPGYGGHTYYNTPYYQAYMNQYGYGQQGFGGPFGGKGGMYGQPHHGYGMPPSSYDQHSSSPANVSGFGQSSLHSRDSGLGSGLGEYGRSGSTQPSQNQQHSSSSGSFGGMPDVFGRSQTGYPGQSQPYGQQQSGQQPGNEDSLKPFGDKGTAGPSPSALGQPGRPGSATNSLPGQGGQSGLPPPQSHQQGFGGYPSHLSGQGSQYGGLGGLGGHQGGQQSHQGGGYSGFGGGYGGSYGSYGRGGWGSNYGH